MTSQITTLQFERNLFRQCIRRTNDRRVKWLLLATLREIQRRIRTGETRGVFQLEG